MQAELLAQVRKYVEHCEAQGSYSVGNLSLLRELLDHIDQLQGHKIAIDDAVARSRETGEPLVFLQSNALAEAETRAENERLRELANDWQRLAVNWQWSAQQVRSERDQLKEINDRMATDRERWRQLAEDAHETNRYMRTQLDAIRLLHQEVAGFCCTCEAAVWPCDTARALGAREEDGDETA